MRSCMRVGLAVIGMTGMMLTGACSEGDGGQRRLLKRTAHSLLGCPHLRQAGAVTAPVQAPGITRPT